MSIQDHVQTIESFRNQKQELETLLDAIESYIEGEREEIDRRAKDELLEMLEGETLEVEKVQLSGRHQIKLRWNSGSEQLERLKSLAGVGTAWESVISCSPIKVYVDPVVEINVFGDSEQDLVQKFEDLIVSRANVESGAVQERIQDTKEKLEALRTLQDAME